MQDDGSTMYFDSLSARAVQGGFLVEYATQENAPENEGVAFILDGKPEGAEVSTIASTFSLKDFGSIKDTLDTNREIDGDNTFLTLTDEGLLRSFVIRKADSSDGASETQFELNAENDAMVLRSLSPESLSKQNINPTIGHRIDNNGGVEMAMRDVGIRFLPGCGVGAAIEKYTDTKAPMVLAAE